MSLKYSHDSNLKEWKNERKCILWRFDSNFAALRYSVLCPSSNSCYINFICILPVRVMHIWKQNIHLSFCKHYTQGSQMMGLVPIHHLLLTVQDILTFRKTADLVLLNNLKFSWKFHLTYSHLMQCWGWKPGPSPSRS